MSIIPLKLLALLTFVALPATCANAESTSETPSVSVSFTPPEGWHMAEESSLSKRVKVMVIGTSAKGFPPSINMAVEDNFKGSVQQYMKVVKSICDNKGNTFKNLGTIKTDAGIGNLSQVDAKSAYGPLRMMHVILIKDGTVYIATATALAEEFPLFYGAFFKAFKSLKIS